MFGSCRLLTVLYNWLESMQLSRLFAAIGSQMLDSCKW